MKFLDWKPIKWFLGLPMKTRIISAAVAGTMVVGSGVGIGVGIAVNNNDNVDSSTRIEESIDSSIKDSSVLDSSLEDSYNDNTSSENSSLESSSSENASADSSESNSSSTDSTPHEHTFTEEVIENTYLKSEATCESKAVYYYTCTFCQKLLTSTINTDYCLFIFMVRIKL